MTKFQMFKTNKSLRNLNFENSDLFPDFDIRISDFFDSNNLFGSGYAR